MGHRKLVSIQPLRTETDALGREREIKRGGTVDKNKYARLTPMEKQMRDNIGNKSFKPK